MYKKEGSQYSICKQLHMRFRQNYLQCDPSYPQTDYGLISYIAEEELTLHDHLNCESKLKR